MPRIASYRDFGCLVTGASSGIGREIARLLAREGARLVLTARRVERLDALAEECRSLGAPEAHVVTADLADPGSVERLVAAAECALGHVDVLVNNAGFAVPGPFVRADEARTRDMLEVNVAAPTALLRRLLPGMLVRGRGGVLNVASMAGLQPAPYQAGYAGTKAYLQNLSASVYQEVRHTNVVVTALCPGVTDTEFFEAAGYSDIGAFLRFRMSAERVARDGLKALSRGRMIAVPGVGNRILVFLERLFTRRFVASVSRRLMGGRR